MNRMNFRKDKLKERSRLIMVILEEGYSFSLWVRKESEENDGRRKSGVRFIK
jgi:hypothetical protein